MTAAVPTMVPASVSARLAARSTRPRRCGGGAVVVVRIELPLSGRRWVCLERPPRAESRGRRARGPVLGGSSGDEVVARVEDAAGPGLVLVEPARVALQPAVDAVLDQGGLHGRVPPVEEVVVERVPTTARELDVGQVTGHGPGQLELDHRDRDRVAGRALAVDRGR